MLTIQKPVDKIRGYTGKHLILGAFCIKDIVELKRLLMWDDCDCVAIGFNDIRVGRMRESWLGSILLC